MYSIHWLQCTSDITYTKITFHWKNSSPCKGLRTNPCSSIFLRYQNEIMNHEKAMLKRIYWNVPSNASKIRATGEPVKKLFVLNLFTLFYDKYTDSFWTISLVAVTHHSEARTTFDREIKFRRFFSALLIFWPKSEWSNSVMENLMAFRPYKVIIIILYSTFYDFHGFWVHHFRLKHPIFCFVITCPNIYCHMLQ